MENAEAHAPTLEGGIDEEKNGKVLSGDESEREVAGPRRYFADSGGWLGLAESPSKGRYLVARRPIPAGQDLLFAEPYGVGVHESHKKRFCQGCYRFTHLPLASTLADEPPSEGHLDGATTAADASTQPELQTRACADVSQAQPTSLTDQVAHEDVAPAVTTSTATAAEEKKQHQQKQKVSRKCTAQVWCERCRQSWYCSVACKEQDRLHPLQCPGLAFLASCKLTKDDKTVVRVLLHVLARRELEAIDGPPPAGVSGKPRFADFLCLVANVPSLATSPDRYKGDMEVVRYVEKMLASCSLAHKYTSQELMEYISKIESNTFGMWSDKLVSMGMVLYAEGSYFNHSCAPNCGTRTGEGQAVQFVATHDIPAGDEVCIRYIDVDKPTTSRRSELLSHYHFTCMCPLCCAESASSSSSSSASSSSAKTKHSHHPARPGKVGKKGKKVKAARKGK